MIAFDKVSPVLLPITVAIAAPFNPKRFMKTGHKIILMILASINFHGQEAFGAAKNFTY